MELLDVQWAAFALALYSSATLLLNTLLILVFYRRRSLNNVSNRFVVNVLAVNTLSSLLVAMVIASGSQSNAANNWLKLCERFLLVYINSALVWGTLLVAVDQYYAVVHPLTCHNRINKTRSGHLLFGAHSLCLALGVAACGVQFAALLWQLLYACAYFVALTTPTVLITAIYVCIYKAARGNSARIRHHHHHAARIAPSLLRKTIPKVSSAPVFLSAAATAQATNLKRTNSDRSLVPKMITQLRCRISNASVFKYREENRTARISALVIFMVGFCHVPLALYLIGQASGFGASWTYPLAVCLVLSSALWSPLLFALRNRRVRRETRALLCGAAKRRRAVRTPRIVIDGAETRSLKECSLACTQQWCVAIPEQCLEARGSFSSASTQLSSDELQE